MPRFQPALQEHHVGMHGSSCILHAVIDAAEVVTVNECQLCV